MIQDKYMKIGALVEDVNGDRSIVTGFKPGTHLVTINLFKWMPTTEAPMQTWEQEQHLVVLKTCEQVAEIVGPMSAVLTAAQTATRDLTPAMQVMMWKRLERDEPAAFRNLCSLMNRRIKYKFSV